MKLESILMSDNEVLRALTMFVEEKWKDGRFRLSNIGCVTEDGTTLREFLEAHDKSSGSLPVDLMLSWVSPFDRDGWMVYVLHTNEEICGMVAITDYNG